MPAEERSFTENAVLVTVGYQNGLLNNKKRQRGIFIIDFDPVGLRA